MTRKIVSYLIAGFFNNDIATYSDLTKMAGVFVPGVAVIANPFYHSLYAVDAFFIIPNHCCYC